MYMDTFADLFIVCNQLFIIIIIVTILYTIHVDTTGLIS